MSFVVAEQVLATNIANGATVEVPYPAGFVQANFTGLDAATGGAVAVGDQGAVVYPQGSGAGTVAMSYGASVVTITNNSGVTWPAGTRIRAQFDRATFPLLTDNSGGTAAATIAAIGATYTQAEVRNAIATLAAAVNMLMAEMRRNKPPRDY